LPSLLLSPIYLLLLLSTPLSFFFFFFFFYCYVDHRYLHSFPTRRSSDLLRAEDALAVGRRRVLLPRRIVPDGDACAEDDRAVRVDRKSTRLNSSHSQISYAVFCLKKKKKKKNTQPQQYKEKSLPQ